MKTETMTKPELVAFAVGLLGGDVDYVDREDVAITADSLAPGRFSWRKYPERIDLEVISVSLRDAKKERYGALVIGSNSQGWMLTPSGLEWLKSLDVEDSDSQVIYRRGSRSEKLEEERTRLRSSLAYELLTENESAEVSLRDFYEFARVNEYYQAKSRQRRFNIVENAVQGDLVLSRVWELLKSKFTEELD